MSLLFETIKIENGSVVNIEFHNERVNKSRRDLLGLKESIPLEKYIVVPGNFEKKIFKCRVFYDEKIDKIEFAEHKPNQIVKLRAVEANYASYLFKFTDRTELNNIKQKYAPKFNEDVLIVKNGLVTDTSIANVVFSDGNKLYTPENPLLQGTQRAYLLFRERITAIKITAADVFNFKEIKLINAMNNLDETSSIPIEAIIF